MPVKPVDTVPDWGSAGNYPASLYPVNLPWGDPNPVGGLPTPWSGQPRLNATAFTSFVNNGFSPQIPTDASSMNEWDRRIGVYVNWVILGTSAADADAHIMETNGAGLSSALAYEATVAFQGVGGTQAPLLNGAVVPTTKVITLQGTGSITGTVSSTVTAGTVDTTSGGIVKTNDVTYYTDSTPGSGTGQTQFDGFRLSLSGEPMSAPIFDYKATATTVSGGTDITGLDITVEVPPTRDVYITLDAQQEVDDVQTPLLRIRATNGVDSVTVLKLGDDDAAVSILPVAGAGARRPNSVRVLWRPTDDFPVPNNDTWTFFAQHGVTGGANLVTTAAALMLDYR